MKKILFSLLAFSYPVMGYMLSIDASEIGLGVKPKGTILQSSDLTLVGILSVVQAILLKGALPIVIVGTTLYIAYHLFTAEGDETRMKNAWRSLGYSSVALIVIALAYAMVSIFTSISL